MTVALRVASLLLLVSVLPHTSALEFEHWQCGSDDASRRIAHTLVHTDCEELAGQLNHCCVIHDDCYVKQLGQSKCDEEFCDCNKRALNNTGHPQCEDHNSLACFMMPIVGFIAYANSVNYTEPVDAVYFRPEGRMHAPFDKLYDQCPDMNTTLSSCTYNFGDCQRGPYGIFRCGQQFASCVLQAGSASQTPTCMPEAVLVAETISRETWRFFDLTDAYNIYLLKNVFLFTLSLFAFACLLYVMWASYRSYLRSNGSSTSLENIKYSAVV